MRLTKWLLGACLVSLFLLVGPSSANAAQAFYPQDEAARTLDAGPAGYVGSDSSEGLCIPQLTCPKLTNSYEPTGGVANSGYLKTSIDPTLAGVASVSNGIFTSAPFVYNGVEGKTPDSLTFKLARRSDVEALLAVTGNSATYSVDLIPSDGGTNVNVVTRDNLAGLTDFSDKFYSLDPDALAVGKSYSIRITTRFESGVQALPSGSVGYDNIRIKAKKDSTGGGNGNGGGGGGSGGGGGNGGGGKLSGNGVVGKVVTLKGDRFAHLIVRVRCNRKPAGRCKLQLQARLRKSGPNVTNKRTVRVLPGHKRRIALDVRKRYVPVLESRARSGKRIVIKQRVRKQGKAVTSFKKVKVKLA